VFAALDFSSFGYRGVFVPDPEKAPGATKAAELLWRWAPTAIGYPVKERLFPARSWLLELRGGSRFG
jgi:hypothetical protein